MFYMPTTKMLFGDAKTSCEGELPNTASLVLWITNYTFLAIKLSLDTKNKASFHV
jgi:hypothetical protein